MAMQRCRAESLLNSLTNEESSLSLLLSLVLSHTFGHKDLAEIVPKLWLHGVYTEEKTISL